MKIIQPYHSYFTFFRNMCSLNIQCVKFTLNSFLDSRWCVTVHIHSKCDIEDYLRYILCSMKVFTMSTKIWIIGSQNFRLVANLHNIIDGLSTKATVFNSRLFAWWRPSCIHRKVMSLVIKGNYIWKQTIFWIKTFYA